MHPYTDGEGWVVGDRCLWEKELEYWEEKEEEVGGRVVRADKLGLQDKVQSSLALAVVVVVVVVKGVQLL